MVQVQSDGVQHDVGQPRSPPRREVLEKLTSDHLAKVHVIYHESKDPNAIPLLLLHGWPGSAFEFIEGERSEGGKDYHSLSFPSILTPNTSTAIKIIRKSTSPAFHLIAPMEPGYGWSTPPPLDRGFNMNDCTALMNDLMVGLGYGDGYAAQVRSLSLVHKLCPGLLKGSFGGSRVATSVRDSQDSSPSTMTHASASTSTSASSSPVEAVPFASRSCGMSGSCSDLTPLLVPPKFLPFP